MTTSPNQPLITLRGVTKRFPGVVALRDIHLDIPQGACVALVGENGAGKSTLGRLLAGIYQPDEGEILLRGKAVHINNPAEASRLGIGMVHQELAFCPNLTVAENLCLGETPRRGLFVDRSALNERARALLAAIHAEFIDVNLPVGRLSTAHEQLVQIASAVGRGAEVVIFDEPTSSLSSVETVNLFQLIDHLKKRGVTIVYVSHRMEEIFRVADSAAILRDGRLVAVEPIAGLNRDSLVRLMIGRDIDDYFPDLSGTDKGRELLRVDNLSSPGKFQNVSFVLREGEILGLGGLVGAGRSEIAKALFGLDTNARGRVVVDGKDSPMHSPRRAMRAGIGFVPEDRKREGLVLLMSICQNIGLPTLRRRSSGPFLHHRREKAACLPFFQRLRIRAPGMDVVTAGLSGGNQQKVALAKWLAADSKVLIVDEPTRGIDLGAKAEIHKLLGEIVKGGRAILLISSEMPELLHLSDRIIVLKDGQIAGELKREEASEERLLRLMTGVV